MPDRPDRLRAMLLGVAVGDALGWPFEMPKRVLGQPSQEGPFHRWRRKAGSRFWSYEEVLPAGTYSDDTQLTLATGRALLHDDWFGHLVRKELPSWRLYERGGGRTVLRSADAWTRGFAPWTRAGSERDKYFASGANGAAMRIAPHVSVGDDLFRRVIADAVATHGHPRALIGAALQAWSLKAGLDDRLGSDAIEALTSAVEGSNEWADESLLDDLPTSWRAAAGSDYQDQWRQGAEGAVALLRRAANWAEKGALVAEGEVLDDLGASSRATSGAGDVCAAAALYLAARYASQPEQAFRAAARQPGADTDTLASMVGALLGALVGPDALASFPGVQDADTIGRLASDLHGAPMARTEIVDELDPKPALAINAFTSRLDDDAETVEFPDGRSATVVKKRVLSDSRSAREVTGHYLRCDDGQGLLVVMRSQRSRSEDAPTPGAVETNETKDAEPLAADFEGDREGGASRGSGGSSKVTQVVDVVLRCREPEAVVRLLESIGLSGVVEDRGWRIEGIDLLIASDEDPTPRLDLEVGSRPMEIVVRVQDMASVCAQLEKQGWKPTERGDDKVVAGSGIDIVLTNDTRSHEQPPETAVLTKDRFGDPRRGAAAAASCATCSPAV